MVFGKVVLFSFYFYYRFLFFPISKVSAMYSVPLNCTFEMIYFMLHVFDQVNEKKNEGWAFVTMVQILLGTQESHIGLCFTSSPASASGHSGRQ